MKSIISINRKFMELNPKELVELIDKNSTFVDGYEINIDYKDIKQINYLKELAFICKNNDKIFQIHGDSSLNFNEQVSFFEMLYPISDMLGYKINVVLHSITDRNKTESIKLTTNYLKCLEKEIDNNRCIISLENLNNTYVEDRLDLNDIMPIVMNNRNIFVTYDIGHVIVDCGNALDINVNMIPLITNVHIHTHNKIYSDGFDHKTIYKDDEYLNEILESIEFLRVNKYSETIVFEYDLYACNGETLEQKIVDYVKSIDYVSARIK